MKDVNIEDTKTNKHMMTVEQALSNTKMVFDAAVKMGMFAKTEEVIAVNETYYTLKSLLETEDKKGKPKET